ncbi:MAG: hypothetical protein JW720_05955 [Sedimentisphaerales bacterium]|nr:hypothetical protein [Sedimentisphaerales bacterium]
MEDDTKNLIQIATRVQEAVTLLSRSRYPELISRLKGFAGRLEELTAESRKLGLALARGWFAAADRCSMRAGRLVNDISYSISHVQQFIEGPQHKPPTLSQIVEELNQLQDEFGNVDFDKGEDSISVVTDPITLEDIPLGPFKIQLELGKLKDLYGNRPYRVIALNPNPASTDDNITHPHVTSQKLCEGNGAAALTASLEQGRLADFFSMVRSILNTYNPDSPYVALADWDGEPCYDCGYTMTSEDSYFCSFCEHTYCDQCSSYCRICEETACLGCSGQCPHCEQLACPNCITRCSNCEELCCESCIEDDLCPTCREELENENEEQRTENTNQNTKTSQPQTKPDEVRLAG